jgi:hypothetical protein
MLKGMATRKPPEPSDEERRQTRAQTDEVIDRVVRSRSAWEAMLPIQKQALADEALKHDLNGVFEHWTKNTQPNDLQLELLMHLAKKRGWA